MIFYILERSGNNIKNSGYLNAECAGVAFKSILIVQGYHVFSDVNTIEFFPNFIRGKAGVLFPGPVPEIDIVRSNFPFIVFNFSFFHLNPPSLAGVQLKNSFSQRSIYIIPHMTYM